MKSSQKIAVIGSGPAGLMVANVLAKAGHQVHVFEKKPGLGRKILIAGSSGLNVSFDSPVHEFLKNYGVEEAGRWKAFLQAFSPRDWLDHIESLGLEVFRGTSGRYFVRGMKGSSLLKSWVDSLKQLGVNFHLNQECVGFQAGDHRIRLRFNPAAEDLDFSAACFCLGGGSWEKTEKPLRWPSLFLSHGIQFHEFRSANVGFKVNWPEKFIEEAEGLPLKGVVFHTPKGSRAGELMITEYGLEGTPIYTLGETGEAWIDLKPGLTIEEIKAKLSDLPHLKSAKKRENLSPIRRIKKYLNLSPAALALLFHMSSRENLNDLSRLIQSIKRFPIQLGGRQPLEEAISSVGGVAWAELDDQLMLKKIPGVFLAGEMIDWHAPTGGFLIQGCISQGVCAGRGILQYLL